MTPVVGVGGKVHHFAEGGLYDGLVLMRDQESGSHWHHVTGTCVHGPLAGEQLAVDNLFQMTASEAAAQHPQALVALSELSFWRRLLVGFQRRRTDPEKGGIIPPHFRRTMGRKDRRLPELAIGLGVWAGQTARFYRREAIEAAGPALHDVLGGRQLLVYRSPQSGTPVAIYVDAQETAWAGDALVLDGVRRLENGLLIERSGGATRPEAPQQLFTRWYGFAFTFPGCEIYEQPAPQK